MMVVEVLLLLLLRLLVSDLAPVQFLCGPWVIAIASGVPRNVCTPAVTVQIL